MKSPFTFLTFSLAVLLSFSSASAAETEVATLDIQSSDVEGVTIDLHAQDKLPPKTRLAVQLTESKRTELVQMVGDAGPKRVKLTSAGQTVADLNLRAKDVQGKAFWVPCPTPDEAQTLAKLLLPDPKIDTRRALTKVVAAPPANGSAVSEVDGVLVLTLTSEDVEHASMALSRGEGLRLDISYSKERLSDLAKIAAENAATKKKVRIVLLDKIVDERDRITAPSETNPKARRELKIPFASVDEAYSLALGLTNRAW
jgi:hypothetical protein